MIVFAKVVLGTQHGAHVCALHELYCFLQSSTEGIFSEAMVLPECTIPCFLFCKHHVSSLFVLQTPPIAPPIAQLLLSSKFLIFLLCFILPPCLPLISGECSIVVLSLFVIWFSCHFTMMNLVIAFFVLPVHHYCIVCVQHAWYGSFRVCGLQYRSYNGLCITTILCACTTAAGTRCMVR